MAGEKYSVSRKESTRTGTAYQVVLDGIMYLLTLLHDKEGSTRRVTHLGGSSKGLKWPRAERVARAHNKRISEAN